MRDLMLRSLPDSVFPLEVRTVGPDDAICLQLQDGHDRGLGVRNTGHRLLGIPALGRCAPVRFLRARSLGKAHFLTPERLHALYPEADAFIDARRMLDPEGTFLNDHLRELFA